MRDNGIKYKYVMETGQKHLKFIFACIVNTFIKYLLLGYVKRKLQLSSIAPFLVDTRRFQDRVLNTLRYEMIQFFQKQQATRAKDMFSLFLSVVMNILVIINCKHL